MLQHISVSLENESMQDFLSRNDKFIAVIDDREETNNLKIVAVSKEEFIQKCKEGEKLISVAQKDDTEVDSF